MTRRVLLIFSLKRYIVCTRILSPSLLIILLPNLPKFVFLLKVTFSYVYNRCTCAVERKTGLKKILYGPSKIISFRDE